MYTTEFSCHGLRKLNSKRLSVLVGFAICALVFYGVNAWLGDRKPKELKGTDNYFLAAAVLFTGWGIFIYFKKRFKIIIDGNDKKLDIEIQDPELNTPVLLNHPFNLTKQWIRVKSGKVHVKALYLTFSDMAGEPIITLTTSLGDLHDAPSRFHYIDLFNPEERKFLKISEQLYTTRVIDIEDLLNIHLTYLSSRKKP